MLDFIISIIDLSIGGPSINTCIVALVRALTLLFNLKLLVLVVYYVPNVSSVIVRSIPNNYKSLLWICKI